MPRKKDDEVVGYEDAITELEDILDALSDDDINVDELAERVKRATELVKVCRERIAAAKLETSATQRNAVFFTGIPVSWRW